jgi:hypothetical protein
VAAQHLGEAQMAIVFNYDKKGLDNLKKHLNGESYVKVGVLNDSKRDNGFGAVELAMVHEFGSSSRGIPERSFMRKTAINNEENFKKIMEEKKKSIEKQLLNGKIDKILGKIGALWVGWIIDTFNAQGPGWPKLSPATIAARKRRKKKGGPVGTNALIDTGAMMRSITYEVITK